jgi:ketosteroid isomerase-like protein
MTTDTTKQNDYEMLTALNRDYIASVQRGDVQRFQEILADDFLCSNLDGSLVARAQFLTQTAQPVTISGLVAEDVQIRLLGDVAIIHARTRYSARATHLPCRHMPLPCGAPRKDAACVCAPMLYGITRS